MYIGNLCGGLLKLALDADNHFVIYIACAVAGFTLCTIPKLHYHVLLAATAMVGATAFMLGVDCFTTAGLKEVDYHLSLSIPYKF
jgi:hypothetical protein